MPRRVCTDKPGVLKDTPGRCFKKGMGVGVFIANKPKVITMGLSKDVLRDIARRSKLKGYSNMKKAELLAGLKAKGVTKYSASDLGK